MTTEQLQSSLGDHRTVAVIGGQFGDEAKGKFVDILAGQANIVARGTGGANAGHTINLDGQETILHLVPSGILHDKDGVATICGSGMVIDPRLLLQELEQLRLRGVSTRNFRLSHKASLVLPQHFLLEQLREKRAGKGKIGTTLKGIGPAYTDKVARIGLVVNDMLNADSFVAKLTRNVEEANRLLESWDQASLHDMLESSIGCETLGTYYALGKGFDVKKITDTYVEYGDQLSHLIDDTDSFMRARQADGSNRILLEGAQGVLLSVEDGAHPFVTSSDCSLAGLTKGVGLKERDVDLTFVVAKAFYMTRVGGGPFPTELGGKESEEKCNKSGSTRDTELVSSPHASVNSTDPYGQGVGFRQAGNEYGSTTGRPRRTGWLDLPLLRYVLGCTGGKTVLALTKLDVLDDCKQIKLCESYEYTGPDLRVGQMRLFSGAQLDKAIVDSEVMRHCRPIYQTYDGWCQTISGIKECDDLPSKLISLIRAVEIATKTEVLLVSVGPDRDQTVLLD